MTESALLFVNFAPLRNANSGAAAVSCTTPRRSSTLRMVAAPERAGRVAVNAVASHRMSVLLPEKLSNEGVALLSETCEVEKAMNLTPEELKDKLADHDAIIIRSATKMTREVIEASPKLKVIGRAGVGVDNIDIPAATERGILVVNAPTGNCVAAAEHAIALMCSLARLISAADSAIKGDRWDRSKFVGTSLVDKKLGLVGLGRIGREVAKRAQGLGMHIVACDPFTSKEAATALGVDLMEREELYKTADFISLHVPLIDSTRHLLNTAAFDMMKPGVRLINAARGGVVDEEALLAALESGKVAGAALDCFEFEPPNKHPGSISEKIAKHPSLLATPHLGASTKEAQEDVAVEVANAVKSALNGDLVPTMINAPAISTELLATLKPRAILCERLGKLAHHVNSGQISGSITVEYFNVPKNTGDTRVLRAAVIKGVMEPALDMAVTIVNADNVAEKHNLSVNETTHFGDNKDSPSEVIVRINHPSGTSVEGRVTNGKPHVTRIDKYELDLALEGNIVVYSQYDQPGQLGKVGTFLGTNNLNISSMTLAREGGDSDKALVLLGLDQKPGSEALEAIGKLVDTNHADIDLKPIVIEF